MDITLQWTGKSRTARQAIGIGEYDRPWTMHRHVTGVPYKARYLDVIDVAYVTFLHQNPDADEATKQHPKLWVDYTQGVDRKPWGPVPVCSHQNRGDYSFQATRCLGSKDRIHCLISFPL